MNVVVFGASGYVGGRLIPVLLKRGHRVRAITRSAASLDNHPWRADVEVVTADLFEPASLTRALEGMDVAYYLVHSMEQSNFADLDRRAAQALASATATAGLHRVVYLGGLGQGSLSEHLESRQEVGRILASGSVPVTEFRAAVVIGSGSLSFEMTRYLTEVLPVMVAPKWVTTQCQPIAIRDVLTYLASCLDEPATVGRVLEIGGPDTVSYEDMIQRYAKVAGLRRRWLIRVPLLSLGLSARWVGAVTPLSNQVAVHLVESLQHEVIVHDHSAEALMPFERIGYDEAVRLALENTRGASVPTRWARGSWQPAEPMPSDPEHAFGAIMRDVRTIRCAAPPADVAAAFMRIGGSNGYYAANWAWRIRGALDTLVGGAGLRRGRRHPTQLSVGEPLDFWRVVAVEPGVALELKAEMKLPGEAWLGWRVREIDGGTELTQTAWFVPRGLLGRAYWYFLVPFHGLIFPRMAQGIIRAADATNTPCALAS
ncbi:MAG: SDR family oxidoreductase [Actinomycetota bacterium]